MICNVIFTFLVLFVDGHNENRTKWMTRDTAEEMVTMYNNGELKEEFAADGIKDLRDFKIVDVPEYDCFRGPRK